MTKINKHFLASGLVVLAGSLPAVAQARVDFNPGGSLSVAPPAAASPAAAASAAAPGLAAVPASPAVAASPTSAASPGSGFDWGDAGIGAGGAVLVLGAGATAVVAGRRRRTQRPLAG